MSDDKKAVNPLASGVAGAIIGAAAAAAAVALSDEKNRKKAEKVLSDMQKEGNKFFKEISRIAMDLKDKGEKMLPSQKTIAPTKAKAAPKKVAKKATKAKA